MINVEHITKRYWHGPDRGWVTAVQDFTLRVAPREFVCILGPSGCGKSTLLNLIAGFEQPTAGRVLFEGREVVCPGPDRGVVFQECALFPWLSARKNVEFALRSRGVPAPERKRSAERFLELVGLADFADAFPHQLSGGMRQRAELARLLALEPKAMLLDEPFGSADAMTRDRLQDELIRIWMQDRKTVVFVTHSIAEAAYLADRVILMGPAPDSFCGEIPVSVPRPRNRMSRELFEVIESLDRAVRALPCGPSVSGGTAS